MEDGPVLRQVDLVSPEHGVDAFAQAGLLGQPTEQRQGLVRDAVLGGDEMDSRRRRREAIVRVAEMDAGRLRGEALAARRVVIEERAEMHLSEFLLVSLERLPRL